MSKGDKRRGNRELKKPKKVAEKVVATAMFSKATPQPSPGSKKNRKDQ